MTSNETIDKKLIVEESDSVVEKSEINTAIVESDDNLKEGSVVEEAYQHIKNIIFKHVHNNMLEVGQYIIDIIYNGDYEAASKKEFNKNRSLRQLFQKFQNDTSGNCPEKTWLYNAINLAIDEKKYTKVSAYGKLGLSHKVRFTNTGKLTEETKKKLIEETVEKEYSVAELQNRITEKKRKLDVNYISLTEKMEPERLKGLDSEKLQDLEKKTKSHLTKTQNKIKVYEENLEKIESALKNKIGE